MITRINHIGIAVNSIQTALRIYLECLGLKLKDIEIIEDQKAKTAIIPVGESKIELIEPTSPDGPVARFLKQRGEGLHHIAFEVDNLHQAMIDVQTKGLPLIDIEPRSGVENTLIAFLHPKDTKVLIELVQNR